MVETSKQVRVDNWGIYFLQRLQLFFSKTDYCDLTLQFEGNVQLKVHRLVMNACTEYFAFLEQTCPALEENTIMMPADLQADVIVPIVNFMYTGMLEFHASIYDKLYKAAEIMNIAVLTKLLEAQLAPISKMGIRAKRDKEKDTTTWKEARKPMRAAVPLASELPAPLPGKKLPVWKKRTPPTSSLQSHPVSATFTNKWSPEPIEKDPLAFTDNTPKPTRFEWPEDDLAPISAMYPSFDDVSLTSKPLWTKEDEQKAAPVEDHPRQYPSRRRSNSASQDYDDEFSEKEAKVNIHQVEEAVLIENPAKRKTEQKISSSPKRVKISNFDEETVISITTSNPSEVDHTKIVSEILKKYPDLVKKKKNIKLKITQSKNEQAQVKVQTVREKAKLQQLPSPVEKPQPLITKDLKREPLLARESPSSKDVVANNRWSKKPSFSFRASSEEGPWTCMECFGHDREGSEFVLYYLFRKHMADQHQVEFDSSLCKYCGKKCPKENLMTYHLYTKHGLKPSRDVAFPKCNVCPFIAVTIDRLKEHTKTHDKDEVQCLTCHLGFLSRRDLVGHQQISGHSNRISSILDCAYCMKKLQSPVTLFTHVRAQHMKEARRDGITSLDEVMDVQDEDVENEEPEERVAIVPQQEKEEETVENRVTEKPLVKERVKIISNMKVTRSDDRAKDNTINKAPGPTRLQAPESETVAVTTTATALGNIGGSLATNLGLVDIVVLDDNQQYILQQPQGQSANEFILPTELTASEGILQAAAATGELNTTDELVMVLTDDYQDEQHQGQADNSNIVVLYSHPVEGQQGQFITSQGNLLVNSEGVLEIRNGTGITTTAGQILVNSTNTTTTPAIQSPVESIDLIRKEIHGSDDLVHDRESIKTALRKNVKEINKEVETEVDQPPVEVNESQTEDSLTDNADDTKKDADALDTTDSSMQEEPMEVDEIEPHHKENVEGNSGQENEHIVSIHAEAEQPAITEKANHEIDTQETQGQDVCPDILPDNPSAEETPAGPLNDRLILNDPSDLVDKYAVVPIPEEVERMEVDDTNLNESSESVPKAVDEVDTHFTEDPEVPSNLETSVQSPHENYPQEDECPTIADQHIQPETTQPDLTCSQEDQSQINNISQDQMTKSQEEFSADNDKECNDNTENHQATAAENNQEEIEGNIENDVNDSNDNVQTNYDDFTDESQQSSGHKSHKDLNKEILDDWDDTDSQQSQGQEPDNQQEQEQDNAALNAAAENVNKLMDDWDEEDEDQTKD